jgi:cytochrome c biogenesis protein CcmG/thiol:disulfide interchange protein DsbE
MRRFAIPGLVSLAAVALLALLVFGVARNTTNTSLDAALAKGIRPMAPAANLPLPILDGKGTEDLADLRGKVVVVNVFASWCVPCAAEASVLERAQRQIAPDGNFVRAYGTTGVPETYVIDRQGRVWAIRRYEINRGWLESELAPLLAQRS